MWKFICRSVRETLERSGERVISAAAEGNLNLVTNSKTHKDQGKKEEQQKQEEQENQKDDSNRNNPQVKLHALLEAVGLSSVLWMGIVGHQHCWRKHRHSMACETTCLASPEPQNRSTCTYRRRLMDLVTGVVNAQPLTDDAKEKQEDLPSQGKVLIHELPADAAMALEEACLMLRNLGSIDNKLGMICVREGWYSEAFNYFKNAWRSGHKEACFNIGICYEQGLGTTQSLDQAVWYYRQASELGHAQAMYNLGVFYSQGLGGLPVDLAQARHLFELAALQGIADAKMALEIAQKDTEETPPSEPTSSGGVSNSSVPSMPEVETEEKKSTWCDTGGGVIRIT